MRYFDLHCDTPYECYVKNTDFLKNNLAVSGEGGAFFKEWKQVFAVWIRDDAKSPFELYRAVLDSFKLKLAGAPQSLTPLFSVEGGAVIEEDSDRLEILKRDGIRLLTLCWNGENTIAGGAKACKGLTDFGVRVIDKMNALKMGCDLSHLNEKSFYKAVERAELPLASHSNCKSLTDSPRNLTDEQIRLIAQKGGVIGLCFYPPFLGEDVFEGVYRNIFHLCEMGLCDNIAIGSDFDGGQMANDLDKIEKIPSLYRFLEGKGIGKGLLDKIFYDNADNFIAKLG